MEGFLSRGWKIILPGVRWLCDPQPISDRPVRLGFPHRAGRFGPGGSPLSSPGCRSSKGIEGFLIREWKLDPLRGARALCTIPSQSATGQCGWGFHTVRGGFDPGDHRCRPRVVAVVDLWRDL